MKESPPRCFSDADRAVDPLLCEEDHNAIFLQWREEKVSLRDTLLGLWGCLSVLALPGGIFLYLTLGPPRLSWFPSIVLSLVGAFLVWRVWSHLILVLRGRAHEIDPREASHGDSAWGDLRENGPPYLECGAPARELAVAHYLSGARGDVSQWLLVLAVALLVAGTAVGALAVAGHLWLKCLVVASVFLVVHAFFRSRREIVFADRVHGTLEAPMLISAKAHKILDLAPTGLLPGGARARSPFIRRGLLALICWVAAYFLATAVILIRDLEHGPLAAFLYAASLFVVAGLVHRRRERTLAEARERQAAWLHFHGLLLIAVEALGHDSSPDAHRWIRWLLSPKRDPSAPCPDLDAQWMAASGGPGPRHGVRSG